jgi:hypothetical protein
MALRILRLRVAELMTVVAISALDFGIVLALLNVAFREVRSSSDAAWFLLLGAMPMANILAVGLIHRGSASRPFLLGFVVFGATALAFYIAVASLYPDGFLGSYLGIFLSWLPYPDSNPPWSLGLVLIASVVVLVLPQIVFALLGGVLFRKFI